MECNRIVFRQRHAVVHQRQQVNELSGLVDARAQLFEVDAAPSNLQLDARCWLDEGLERRLARPEVGRTAETWPMETRFAGFSRTCSGSDAVAGGCPRCRGRRVSSCTAYRPLSATNDRVSRGSR